jgi:adenosylcobyric acid synthase
VRSQESGVRSQGSGVRGQESGVRGQKSGVRNQESGVREEGSASLTPDPCPLTPIPDPWPLTPSIDIAVIHLPHISNFDDFDPLRAEAGVGLRYVQSPAALGKPDVVILPGTKSTIADLAWLRSQGFADAIHRLVAHGVSIVGVCGGYQMLGRVIRDSAHVESSRSEVPGLGLLPVETTFEPTKATFQVGGRVLGGPGWLEMAAGQELQGYEIHMGRTHGGRPWLEIAQRGDATVHLTDGSANDDGTVWGCYLHGLFANSVLRRLWLASLSELPKEKERPRAVEPTGATSLHASLDRLADTVEAALDMRRLETILGEDV